MFSGLVAWWRPISRLLSTYPELDLYLSPPTNPYGSRSGLRSFKSPFRHVYDRFRTIGTISGRDAWSGLFRGLGPSLAGIVPATTVKCYVYGNCQQLWCSVFRLHVPHLLRGLLRESAATGSEIALNDFR